MTNVALASDSIQEIASDLSHEELRKIYFRVLRLYPTAPTGSMREGFSLSSGQAYGALSGFSSRSAVSVEPGEPSVFAFDAPCLLTPITEEVSSSPRMLQHQGGSLFLRGSSVNIQLKNTKAYHIPAGGFCLLPVKSNLMVFLVDIEPSR